MSTSSLSEWPLFPLKVLKTFPTSRRNSFDYGQKVMKEVSYKEDNFDSVTEVELTNENPTKKSYFEITSIEEHDQKDQPKLDPNNKKTVYMVKINNFKRGRWSVTDSKAPDSNLDKCVKTGQSVEFIDKETGDQWLFGDSNYNQAVNSVPAVELPAAVENVSEINQGTGHIPGTRFIVRSIITSKNGNIIKCDSMASDNEVDVAKTINSPEPYNNNTKTITQRSISPTSLTPATHIANTPASRIVNITNTVKPDVKAKPSAKLEDVHEDLINLNVSSRSTTKTPPPNVNEKYNPIYTQPQGSLSNIYSNSASITESKNIIHPVTIQNQKSFDTINSSGQIITDFESYSKPQDAPINIKYFTNNSSIPSTVNAMCSCKHMVNIQNSNYTLAPYDTFNKSLDKITRVHSATLQSLTGQLTILNDHIVELNNTILMLRSENECLKHEHFQLHNLLENHNKSLGPEIVRCTNDESVFMLAEIMPGRKRLLNITKFLTTDEINYINLIKK